MVGFFTRLVRRYVLARLPPSSGSGILEIGCGEALFLEGTGITPVQIDVSMVRLRRAAVRSTRLACADGYQLPFFDAQFDVVLLIAVLEHTARPWAVLAEARRVLKPGGRAIMLVPNDVTMSVGRLILGKFPIRYPDHLTWTTPRRMRRWLHEGFRPVEAFPLPIPLLPFAANLYYFVVAERI